MRRTLVCMLLIAAFSVFPLLAGGQAEEKGPVEIDFYYALGGVLGEFVEELVEEYNEMQDEVTINASFQGTYGETANKVMADISGKTHPSLAMVSLGNIPQFLDVEGLVVDFNTFSDDSDFDYDDIIPALREAGTFNDRFIAMPSNTSTQLFYYNKDMFEEVGLDPNEPPQDWESLRSAAKQISDYNEDYYGYVAFGKPFEHWLLEYLFWSAGGDILSGNGGDPVINSSESLEGFEFLHTLVNDDESSVLVPYGDSLDLFKSGQAGMLIASTGSLGEIQSSADFAIGTAPNPAGPDKQTTSMGGGYLMMFDHGREINEAAWDFVKYMVNTENTARMNVETGYMPIRHSAAESDLLQDHWKEVPQARAAFDGLSGARARYTHTSLTEIHDILARAVDAAILEETMTPKEALDRAQSEAMEAVSR